MFHGCRIAVYNEYGKVAGFVPIWFIGVGIISSAGMILSLLSIVPPIFWGMVVGVTVDVWWYVFAVPTFFVCMGLYLWYNEVMESLARYTDDVMSPALRPS